MFARNRLHALVVAAYVALALWVTHGLWADPDLRVPPGHEPDPDLFKWFIAYAARAVTKFENPFYTTMTGYPDGVNLLGNTSVLGLAIPLTPLTLLFGSGVTFLAMTTLGLAGSAAGWYLVFRRLAGRSILASALAGGFCGFAPAMVAHALGHLHLTAAFLVPFIVYFSLKLADPGKRVRHGIYLGLLITWQVFIGAELLLLTAFGLAAFVIGWALVYPRAARERVVPLVRGLLVAGGLASVLLVFPLYYWFFGPQSYHGLGSSAQHFGADLGSFLRLPTQSLFGDRTENAAYAQNYAEENTFYGWPVVACVVLSLVLLRKVRLAWVLAGVSVVFAVAALGATITQQGKPLGEGPWALVSWLPLLDSIIPTRFGMVALPCLGLLLAMAIDKLRETGAETGPETRFGRKLRLAGVAVISLALLTLFPTALPAGPQTAVPQFITSGAWKPYVAEGQTLVPVPLPSPDDHPEALRWAAATTIGFAMPKGYFLRPESGRGSAGAFRPPDRFTAALLTKVDKGETAPPLTDVERQKAAEDADYWDVASFVLLKTRPRAEQLKQVLTELYGEPASVQDVWVWDVRD